MTSATESRSSHKTKLFYHQNLLQPPKNFQTCFDLRREIVLQAKIKSVLFIKWSLKKIHKNEE